jgi:hypothetical protein
MRFWYLEYHTWTFISNFFQYHYPSIFFKMPHRINSPFSKQQEIWIVANSGELTSPTELRRKFRLHYKLSPRLVPASGKEEEVSCAGLA